MAEKRSHVQAFTGQIQYARQDTRSPADAPPAGYHDHEWQRTGPICSFCGPFRPCVRRLGPLPEGLECPYRDATDDSAT